MQRIMLLCAGLAVCLFTPSCEKSNSKTSATSQNAQAEHGGSGIRLVYIPKNTGNPYFDPMIEGFRAAADETGMQFDTVAPATADATSQLPLIKAQVQRGVDVIAISPNSTDALNQAFKEALAKGVLIITVDSDITGNESLRTAGVLTVDPKTVGQSQVELMGSLIGYQGKFAILSATTEAPNQNMWIGYMKEAMKDPKYKQMEFVGVVYGDDEPQKSTTETEALLSKYPDLRGIIAPTTVGVMSAAQVVQSTGKASQVQVTGLGTPNQMRPFIKDGTVKAFALWSPYDEGYLAGQLSYLLATKKMASVPGTKFSAGKLGERELKEKNIVITGPPVTFTKDNIDQFKF